MAGTSPRRGRRVDQNHQNLKFTPVRSLSEFMITSASFVFGSAHSAAMDDLLDDEVLCTVPVYLSQELAQSLYVVQYPLRPADRPYEDDLGACCTDRCAPPFHFVTFLIDSSERPLLLPVKQDNLPLRASSPKIKSSNSSTASIRTATILTRAPRASPSRSRSARAPCRRRQTMPSAFCAKAGLGKGVRCISLARKTHFFI